MVITFRLAISRMHIAKSEIWLKKKAESNLVRLIRCKIQGEARRTITGVAFNTVAELLKFLNAIHSSPKTVSQLHEELGHEYQTDHENVITYANRLKYLGIRILETY